MKTLGIIAEYDPFHNGHKYNLNALKEKNNCDNVVVIMSGNYTQRGDISLIPKDIRALTAVKEGADLVLELPIFLSCSSAMDFARGGISFLMHSGITDVLGFGCETEDMSLLSRISDIISEEPEDYKNTIKELTSLGYSFPKARAEALKEYVDENAIKLMEEPNAILAIEYLRAIKDLKWDMPFSVIKRKGAAHDSDHAEEGFCSASYIREKLLSGGSDPYDLAGFMPDSTVMALSRHMAYGDADNMSPFLLSELYRLNSFDHIYDISYDLSNRLRFAKDRFTTFSEFALTLKTKDITLSRIRRALMHLINDVTKDDMDVIKETDYCPYISVLAANESKDLLKKLYAASDVPILYRDSDGERYLNEKMMLLLKKSKKADQRYIYSLKA